MIRQEKKPSEVTLEVLPWFLPKAEEDVLLG
jgi:hypothetical protein